MSPTVERITARRSSALVCVVLTLMTLASACSKSPAKKEANHLNIMTNAGSWAGFDKSALNSASSVLAFYKYFHDIWEKKFPGLTLTEQSVKDMSDATSKTLLAVQSKNPADLIPVGG